MIRSMTGDVIAEFTKEQGNFVTPRGKYGIQMTSTFMHMQGSQYSYKIKYTDIGSLYLLPKLEGGREAFVIALEKPIRQGAQKYQYLVLETHKIEHTMTINLTEDEIKAKYEGHLSPEMTMPTSHLIAKIFKVLSQTPVSGRCKYGVVNSVCTCVWCTVCIIRQIRMHIYDMYDVSLCVGWGLEK